jgi:hypothetical protein
MCYILHVLYETKFDVTFDALREWLFADTEGMGVDLVGNVPANNVKCNMVDKSAQ